MFRIVQLGVPGPKIGVSQGYVFVLGNQILYLNWLLEANRETKISQKEQKSMRDAIYGSAFV